MRLTVAVVLGVLAVLAIVTIISDSSIAQVEPEPHAATINTDTLARSEAFSEPILLALVQQSMVDPGWDWKYDVDREACLGSQEIVSRTTSAEIAVPGDSIAIGSSGLVEIVLPPKATVYPTMDITLGSSMWTIPYLSAQSVNNQAQAVFHGGMFVEAPAGGIPTAQTATAKLEVSPVTAYQCYGVVHAGWREQAVIAFSSAFPLGPTPTPVPEPSSNAKLRQLPLQTIAEDSNVGQSIASLSFSGVRVSPTLNDRPG